eukprot:UN24654
MTYNLKVRNIFRPQMLVLLFGLHLDHKCFCSYLAHILTLHYCHCNCIVIAQNTLYPIIFFYRQRNNTKHTFVTH